MWIRWSARVLPPRWAQIIQLPGVAGTENNLLIFEFSKITRTGWRIIDNFKLTAR